MRKKITGKLIWRKMKEHRSGFIGIGTLIMVGVAFFITLFTITFRYEETAEAYFKDQHYASVTIKGIFTDDSVGKVEGESYTEKAAGRYVEDIRKGETVYRAISLTEGINTPYLYEGSLPENGEECVILKRNADVIGVGIGDTIELNGKVLKVTGLIASPEYVYMIENERSAMTPEDRFVVLYTDSEFFTGPYNEIVALTDEEPEAKELLKVSGGTSVTYLEDQLNYKMYKGDLDQISTFAYIFPAVVIYIMLARTMAKERKILGIEKAMGVTDYGIIRTYITGYAILAIPSALLGCVVAMLLCNTIIGIMSSMFVVPTLGFVFYPLLWLGAIGVSCLICLLSGWLGMAGILKLSPAQAMRPREPKGGKKILLEHFPKLWKKFSWGTRYSVKSALRNKGRFFAVVLGMCASCALITFSLGFYNSIENTQNQFFDNVANYDAIMDFNPMPLAMDYPATSFSDDYAKALALPVKLDDVETSITVVDTGFDMLSLPKDDLETGVVVPAYIASELEIKVGDMIDIQTEDVKESTYTLKVSGIVDINMGLSLYTSWDYLRGTDNEIPEVYNALFMRTDNIGELEKELQNENMSFSTIEEDRTSLGAVMESVTVLIGFMIACAVVLGVAVLYSVGQINLAARSYEYMFMGVMGYSRKNILIAHVKETIFQLILAIPIGYLLGNLLLEIVKGAFSGTDFVVAASIYPISYIIGAGVTVVITALMIPVTAKYIDKMDLVEGLKEQNE